MGVASALAVRELGRISYAEALALQHELVAARRRGECGDTLLLLEHPPVVTLGRSAHGEHLLVAADALAARGVSVHEVARGGDVTYHGPGQLVGYPIVDLAARGARDVHAWLRTLEELIGEALLALGVRWRRIPGWTGVFVADDREGARPRKIASIGVGVRGWVTLHGFALNVDLDLAGFDAIVPCGLHAVEMTSVARELGARAPADLGERARAAVRRAFEARLSRLGRTGSDA
jgi:lipoyl(octanoyl) transferase